MGFAETKAHKSTEELFAFGVVSSRRSSQPALRLLLIGLVKHAQKEEGRVEQAHMGWTRIVVHGGRNGGREEKEPQN